MRSRGRLAAVLGVVVVAGLASRRAGAPAVIEDHAGDVLWATAVVIALALVWPAVRPGVAAGTALAVACGVEVSQAWNPAWLDHLRDNELVAVFLGRGFLWSDLPRYAIGCLVGFGVLRLLGPGVGVSSDGPTAPS